MPNAQVNLGVVYTPPAAANNSGQAVLNSTAVYAAQSVGTIDVPTTTAANTTFQIPFNSINVGAQVCVIQNNTPNAIGIRFNAALADNFNLESGASFSYSGPTIPTALPLTSVQVTILTAPVSPSTIPTINYWVFGS